MLYRHYHAGLATFDRGQRGRYPVQNCGSSADGRGFALDVAPLGKPGLIQPIRTATGQRVYDRSLVDRLKRITWLRTEKGPQSGCDPGDAERAYTETDVEAPETEDDASDIRPGTRMRRLRREAGKTLENVAQATGVSVSQLSTFERTSQGLSFTALHEVRAASGHHFGVAQRPGGGQRRRIAHP